MSDITTDDMKNMQQDAFSYKASDYVEMIKNKVDNTNLSESEKQLYKVLTSWDYNYKSASEAPVLFELFYNKLNENTWDELIEIRKTMSVRLPEGWRLLELIVKDPENRYFDLGSTKAKENANDILVMSLKDAFGEFEKLKKEKKGTTWGKFKPLHIYHLTRLPAFSSMDIATDGCSDAINAVGNSMGPSWRMVISLEEKIKAYGVYPGGQSGNPSSKYYKNMIETWTKGEYYTLNSTKKPEDIRQLSTQSIQIIPKK